MRKANLSSIALNKLASARIPAHERERAEQALRDAEVIVDGILWVGEKIASLGALVLRPGFKH